MSIPLDQALEIERGYGAWLAAEHGAEPEESATARRIGQIDQHYRGKAFSLAFQAAMELALPLDLSIALARGFVERADAAYQVLRKRQPKEPDRAAP